MAEVEDETGAVLEIQRVMWRQMRQPWLFIGINLIPNIFGYPEDQAEWLSILSNLVISRYFLCFLFSTYSLGLTWEGKGSSGVLLISFFSGSHMLTSLLLRLSGVSWKMRGNTGFHWQAAKYEISAWSKFKKANSPALSLRASWYDRSMRLIQMSPDVALFCLSALVSSSGCDNACLTGLPWEWKESTYVRRHVLL